MNYRHVFHAGNFADVVKHVILISLLSTLTRKPNALCYVDTHAGRGYYDLSSLEATKSKEYLNGVEKIIQQENPPPLIRTYLDVVHKINNQLSQAKFASLQYYPGSPLIARNIIRPQDRMVICELQREEYQALRSSFVGDKQVAVHHTDGFLGLKAFLPPKEKRGLILIDPPYEDPDEFTHIIHSLSSALKKFETGTYAIWYPIKEKPQVERFHRALKQFISQPILVNELTIYPYLPSHLNGCGMAIINPPYQFNETINELLPWLWKALTINNQGSAETFTLK